MAFLFRDQWTEARRSGSIGRQAAVWIRTVSDLITVAPKERYYMILQDVRYALRTFAKNPSYAGTRHWSQHGDFQSDERGFAIAASGERARATGNFVESCCQRRLIGAGNRPRGSAE